MSDWRPRDPTGPAGATPPPGWGTPFPPEKPRRDAPVAPAPAAQPQQPQPQPLQYQEQGAYPAFGVTPGAPTAPAPYGAQDAPPSPPPYGAAPAQPTPPPPSGYGAHSYAAAAVPGAPLFAPLPDPMTENRRHLDWRRIRATRIDGFLMIPVGIALILLFRHQPITAYFLILAINLSYHFVMETACGQTFGKRWKGLRVVRRDGSAAGASAIAARTVFRIIDAQFVYLVGLITMVITGKKRQRLGDLAAGTIVREDDRPWKPAPSSPLLVIYPILWVGAALFFGSQLDPKPVALTSDPYMQQIDRICELRTFAERTAGAGTFEQALDISRQETSSIEALPAPITPAAIEGRRIVLHWRNKIDKTGALVLADARASSEPQATLQQETPRLLEVIKRSNARMRDLGLPHCIE